VQAIPMGSLKIILNLSFIKIYPQFGTNPKCLKAKSESLQQLPDDLAMTGFWVRLPAMNQKRVP